MELRHKLLSEVEAANKLGITVELLFKYTRYPPKKNLGHLRTLRFKAGRIKQGFFAQDLEDWDKYLWEAWSNSAEDRPEIPPYIKDYLKVESQSRCALCGKGYKLEYAHIIPYPISLSHHHHNLIRLCEECHGKYDDGIISAEEVQKAKDRLVERVRSNLVDNAKSFSRADVFRVPQPSKLFVGRKSQLMSLRKQIKNQRLIIVEGVGGIGKTELVLQALKTCKDLPTIWFNVESYENFDDLKLAFQIALVKEGLLVQTDQSVFDALCEKLVRIVFDGLDRISSSRWEQVLDFVGDLAKLTEEPRFVITTQVEIAFPGIEYYSLKLAPLAFKDSKQFIYSTWKDSKYLDEDGEKELGWVIGFCDGHPLSLQLSTGLLRYYKDPGIVAERLRSVGAKELKDPVREEQKRSTSLAICLQVAYSCLTHAQKRLLQFVSNFPGGCMDVMAHDWHKSNDYQLDVAELKRFFLVDVHIDLLKFKRIFLLNPVRQFVRGDWQTKYYNEAAEIQREAATKLRIQAAILDYEYVNSKQLDLVEWGLIRIDVDLRNFIAAINYGQCCAELRISKGKDPNPYLELVGGIASSLSKYFFIRGLFKFGISFLKDSIRSFEQMGNDEQAAEQYSFLYSLQDRSHDRDGVEESIRNLVALAKKTQNPKINALASLAIGDQYRKGVSRSESLKHYEDAVQYFRSAWQNELRPGNKDEELEVGRYNEGMLAVALGKLGKAHEDLGHFQEALKFYLEALDHQIAIGDNANIGSSYHHIGNCYAHRGDAKQALESYKCAIEYFMRLGYAQFISNSLSEIGELVVKVGISPDLESFLSTEILQAGLDDARHEVELVLESKAINDIPIVRKLFGVVKLVSFTSRIEILMPWAQNLFQEVLCLNRSRKTAANPLRGSGAFFHECFIICTLASGVAELSAKDGPITQEEIDGLYDWCEEFSEVACDLFNPFRWVDAWLKHRRLNVG